jgi:hypothetical protein
MLQQVEDDVREDVEKEVGVFMMEMACRGFRSGGRSE